MKQNVLLILIEDFKAWPLVLSCSIKKLGAPTVFITGKKQPGLILACVIEGERNYRRGSLPKKWPAWPGGNMSEISYYTVHKLYINTESTLNTVTKLSPSLHFIPNFSPFPF